MTRSSSSQLQKDRILQRTERQVLISHPHNSPMQQLKWQDALVLANLFQPFLETVCSVRPSMDGQAYDQPSMAKRGHTRI